MTRTVVVETIPPCAPFAARALSDSRDRFGEVSELVDSEDSAVRLAKQEGGPPKVVVYIQATTPAPSRFEIERIARFYAIDAKRVEVRVLPGEASPSSNYEPSVVIAEPPPQRKSPRKSRKTSRK